MLLLSCMLPEATPGAEPRGRRPVWGAACPAVGTPTPPHACPGQRSSGCTRHCRACLRLHPSHIVSARKAPCHLADVNTSFTSFHTPTGTHCPPLHSPSPSLAGRLPRRGAVSAVHPVRGIQAGGAGGSGAARPRSGGGARVGECPLISPGVRLAELTAHAGQPGARGTHPRSLRLA